MTSSEIRNALAAHGGLCAIGDLAVRWGMTKQGARKVVQRPGFPAPVAVAGDRRFWLADEADAFRRNENGYIGSR